MSFNFVNQVNFISKRKISELIWADWWNWQKLIITIGTIIYIYIYIYVSQAKTTSKDPQFSPIASSDSGSLSQVRWSSQVSYPVEGLLSYPINRFPQNIELTSCQFNLLMNLNRLLKPSIILAGEMLCKKNEMPRNKIKISEIWWVLIQLMKLFLINRPGIESNVH